MLLIDRLVAMEAFRRATGIKQVTINEPFFQGHFPSDPIMPGVLIVEAMAQTAAALVISSLGEGFAGNLVYFMGVDEARFRRPVRPGSSCGSRSRFSAAGSASTASPAVPRSATHSPPRPFSAPR